MKQEYYLPKQWADYLLKQPETGQGYQIADVYFDDGKVLEGITILNAEKFFSGETDLDLSRIEKIILKKDMGVKPQRKHWFRPD